MNCSSYIRKGYPYAPAIAYTLLQQRLYLHYTDFLSFVPVNSLKIDRKQGNFLQKMRKSGGNPAKEDNPDEEMVSFCSSLACSCYGIDGMHREVQTLAG